MENSHDPDISLDKSTNNSSVELDQTTEQKWHDRVEEDSEEVRSRIHANDGRADERASNLPCHYWTLFVIYHESSVYTPWRRLNGSFFQQLSI
jgi:hypothetical protein